MQRWLGLAIFLSATTVASRVVAQEHEEHQDLAAPEHGESAGAEHEGVAPFILHHLADNHEYEIEVPLSPSKNVKIELPVIRIPLVAGACPANVEIEPKLTDGCLDMSITKHTVMMWLAALLLIFTFFVGSHRNKNRLVPHGASENLLELLVLFVRDEMAVKNIGKQWGTKYTPYLLTIFFFILFMNLIGLVPELSAATGNLAVTAGLALCTFFVTQFASIRAAGLKTYLKHLTGGVHWGLWIIMIPVEFLGLFTKPFALTVRLFANMLAGHIVIFFLLGLIFVLQSPAVGLVAVPFAMAIYFLELFVAFVQAYIFTMLSSLFIGMGVAMAHHDDHGAHDHAAADHGKAHA